ncbi:MAG: transglutaminase family protein [Phenylobacterium sp.]|uniref:transglutaminase family protein n=1 Tax=Phenylobacterium sp. TaxID=1871053 RepID=UPI0025D43EEB|nr:transglutaminase family protein [Phenylobacterium sp.]MBI1200385.1 transglutaminase family protein [Phenylobacterium sp.]
MIYDLRHRTTYNYQDEVSFARCVLRLTPRDSATQTVLESSLTVTPEPSARRERTGPFGARIVTVRVDTPHRELVIEARARIDVHVPPPPDFGASLPWEAVRAAALMTRDIGPEGAASFLFPTPRTPITPQITDYARQSFPPGRPILAAVAELNARIHADFRYDPGATEVSTPVAQAFAARHGVCQDFTQIMIVGLRGLGLPAAYVSGYLRTIPPPGQPRLEGADATHAWVSVWCGEATGWVGFDPTNAILADNDHIALAVGRDYADVAPIDGVILASGAQTLKVEVDVIPQEEPPLPHAKREGRG